MKKYKLVYFAFILSFILSGFFAFNTNTASALNGAGYASGCTSTFGYSTTTGQSCANPHDVVGCSPGFLFSSVTGQSCSTTNLSYGCFSGYTYNVITGQPCSKILTPIIIYPPGCYSYLGYSSTTGQSCSGGGAPSQPSSVTVIRPNGSEAWTKGTTQRIEWSNVTCGTGYCGDSPSTYHDINLISYQAIQDSRTIARSVYGSSYEWVIPNCGPGHECSSNFDIGVGTYQIQVCQTGTSICDSSNSYFNIVNAPTYSIYPSGCYSYSGWSSTTGMACNGSTMSGPVVTVTSNPSTISLGALSTISWSSTGNNLSCHISLSDGLVSSSGSQIVYPTSTTYYSVTCTDLFGTSGSGSAVVNVVAPKYRSGCSSDQYYSSIDGQSCALPSGCSSYSGWSTITGQSCSI